MNILSKFWLKRILWICFMVFTWNQYALSQGINQQIQKAQVEFENGNYSKASRILSRIIQTNPSRTDAIQLMGRVYFRKGQFKIARDYFRLISANQLSREAGYAWGASFFSSKEWKRAILGFRKVPRSSQYRNLSAYYLGICYYRLKRWYPAKSFLLKSNDAGLFPVMIKNKQHVLVEVERLRDEELSRVLGASNPQRRGGTGARVIQSLPNQKFVFAEVRKGSKPRVKQKISPFSFKPEIMVTQLNRDFENHGFADETLSVIAHREQVASTYYNKKKGYGILFGGGYGAVDIKSITAKFVSLEQTTGAFIRSETTSSNEAYALANFKPFLKVDRKDYNFTLALNLNLNLPIDEDHYTWGHALAEFDYEFLRKNLSVVFGGYAGQRYDLENSKPASEVNAFARLSWITPYFTVGLNSSITERFDLLYQTRNPYRYYLVDGPVSPMNGYGQILEVGTSISTKFKGVNMKVLAQYTNQDKITERVAREESTDLIDNFSNSAGKIEGSASYSLFDGLELFVGAYYKILANYLSKRADPDGTDIFFQAGVTQLGSNIGVAAQPLSWLTLNANFGNVSSEYEADNFVMSTDFQKNNPDFLSTSTFYVNAFYEF